MRPSVWRVRPPVSVEGSLSKRSDSHDEWERKSEGGKAKGAKFEKKKRKGTEGGKGVHRCRLRGRRNRQQINVRVRKTQCNRKDRKGIIQLTLSAARK